MFYSTKARDGRGALTGALHSESITSSDIGSGLFLQLYGYSWPSLASRGRQQLVQRPQRQVDLLYASLIAILFPKHEECKKMVMVTEIQRV